MGVDSDFVAIIMGASVGILFLLVVYLYLRESDTAKRLRHFERSIEALNKQLYQLQKRLQEDESQSDSASDLSSALREEVREELHRTILGMQRSLDKSETAWQEYHDKLEEKMIILEERIKEMSYFPSSSSGADETRILNMFKDGWSIDSIARELRIGRGEVEFTLKLANIP